MIPPLPLLAPVLGSIPSPGSGQIHIGPLRITAYGLMIALGVLAAVEIARRRHAARGGNPDDMSAIALWGVIAGLIGARLYHVLTDLDRFQGNWGDVIRIWEGGLGIPGGLLAGTAAGLWAARRRGLRLGYALDIGAPAVPAAQAIGRWGNWWNQELFGRPTDLPWGLEIDPRNRPPAYPDEPTFHPTFLYESVWNIGIVVALLWFDRRYPQRLRPGSLFALYVAGYGLGRLWIELLRVDPAQEIGGVRFNAIVALVALVGGAGYVAIWGRRRDGGPPEAGPAPTVGGAEPTASEPAPADSPPAGTAGDEDADGSDRREASDGEASDGAAVRSTGSERAPPDDHGDAGR